MGMSVNLAARCASSTITACVIRSRMPLRNMFLYRPIEDQRRKGVLEDIALRTMDPDHGGFLTVPHIALRFVQVKEAVVVQLLETTQQILQSDSRLRAIAHDLQESS